MQMIDFHFCAKLGADYDTSINHIRVGLGVMYRVGLYYCYIAFFEVITVSVYKNVSVSFFAKLDLHVFVPIVTFT